MFGRKAPAAESTYTPETREQYQAALANGDQAAAKKIERKVASSGTKKDQVQLLGDFQAGYHR